MFWDDNHPALVASAPEQPDRRLPLAPGTELGLHLGTPRTCVGVWDPNTGQRAHCFAAIPVQGTEAQCGSCAFRDRGRALARDAHADDRDYTLYLAFFGPGLIKVGLTASERGHARLLEQGALTYTLLAHGPLEAVRAAEQAIARAGLATERVRGLAKAAAWAALPPPEERRAVVLGVRSEVEAAGLLPGTTALDARVHDNTATYHLHPVSSWEQVTAFDEDAVLAVRVRAVPGRLLLAEEAGTGRVLLIDSRLLAGRPTTPSAEPPRGLHTTHHEPPSGDDHGQDVLF